MFQWICPVCALPLNLGDKSWSCTQGHNFDKAKSGYINLLLAQHKASKQPGDDKNMLAARRDFLNAGYYASIAKGIAATLNNLYSQLSATPTLLDCGCGEGYYLQQLSELLTGDWCFAGIDIAKSGVEMAAKRPIAATWICASNARLPLAANSTDVLLRIFTPEQDAEAHRVLIDKGHLIVVSPAEHHLKEIKERLYDQVKPYATPSLPPGFSLVSQHSVNAELQLNANTAIQQLLQMTPFSWRGKREVREELLQEEKLQVQIDILISCYQKLSTSPTITEE